MSFGYHRASAHEGFVDMALETVSYQEYSAKYPHVQWSVGFMGRPSGPDFYINKKDNTIAHGPGDKRIRTICTMKLIRALLVLWRV